MSPPCAPGSSVREASWFPVIALAAAVGCEGSAQSAPPFPRAGTAAAESASARQAPASCGPVHVVVLGSSSAAGTGPAASANAWVERYRRHLDAAGAGHALTNLARGGYNTYRILPRGFGGPEDHMQPDPARNIERALAVSDAIIISLPSNDANLGIDVATQLANYDTVLARADAAGAEVWVTTTQPRNFDAARRATLRAMRDSTMARFGDRAIDFYTGLARPDGTISSVYDAGDGIHLNDAGHAILFARVADARIPETVSCGARGAARSP